MSFSVFIFLLDRFISGVQWVVLFSFLRLCCIGKEHLFSFQSKLGIFSSN